MNKSSSDGISQPNAPGATFEQQAAKLVAWFDSGPYAIAFSGGVDSAVVCKAAAVSTVVAEALTARSPSVAATELADAAMCAKSIGIAHRFVETSELSDEDYSRNDFQRCYHCKSHLFAHIRRVSGDATIVTGTNADDLGDYRPGLQAAAENQVRAPLAELGYGKATVRGLANYWAIEIADKPASPCLASRLAYGLPVTSQRLQMVEAGETYLRSLGLRECRVRMHADDHARIEVPAADLPRIASEAIRVPLIERFHGIGFRFVSLDLEGFRSGSLNQVIPLSL